MSKVTVSLYWSNDFWKKISQIFKFTGIHLEQYFWLFFALWGRVYPNSGSLCNGFILILKLTNVCCKISNTLLSRWVGRYAAGFCNILSSIELTHPLLLDPIASVGRKSSINKLWSVKAVQEGKVCNFALSRNGKHLLNQFIAYRISPQLAKIKY